MLKILFIVLLLMTLPCEVWAVNYCDDADIKACFDFDSYSLVDVSGTVGNITNNGAAQEGSDCPANSSGECFDLELDDSDYMVIADDSDIDFADEDFTVCAWVKPETITGRLWIKGWDGASGVRYDAYIVNDDDLGGAVDDNANKTFCNDTTPAWSGGCDLVCTTRDVAANDLDVWIDGVNQCNATDITGSIAGQNSADLIIGANQTSASQPSGDYYDGFIGGFYIWERVLSAAEMIDIAANGIGITYGAPATRRIMTVQ